jgi:hypothetical protein
MSALTIDVTSRREAVDMLAQLRAPNAYLVQLGPELWQVCVQLVGLDGRRAELESTARRLAADRALAVVVEEVPVPAAG